AIAGAPAAKPRAISTPSRLRLYRAIAIGLAAVAFFVGEGSLSRARGALKTIGTDTAPSIIAAQDIASALADLDANAANYLIGAALILTLLMAQAFLARRTRRILNVGLALATLLAAGFTIYVASAIGQAREHLRIAVDDAFDSIHVLYVARSLAYDADGDESR